MIVGIDVEVISESWVAGASGYWLLVQVDSWVWVAGACGFWIFWVSVAVFFGFG